MDKFVSPHFPLASVAIYQNIARLKFRMKLTWLLHVFTAAVSLFCRMFTMAQHSIRLIRQVFIPS